MITLPMKSFICKLPTKSVVDNYLRRSS